MDARGECVPAVVARFGWESIVIGGRNEGRRWRTRVEI
jgi:hypothetical protein